MRKSQKEYYVPYTHALKLFHSEKLSESLTGIEPVTLWSPVRCSNQYINVTFAHHLSPCSSIVRASHRRSEVYGFDEYKDHITTKLPHLITKRISLVHIIVEVTKRKGRWLGHVLMKRMKTLRKKLSVARRVEKRKRRTLYAG